MRRTILCVLISLFFTSSLYTIAFAQSSGGPGSLTVSISPQRFVMDVGQTDLMSATITGGDGNYLCTWTWNKFTTPSVGGTFGTGSCSATFYGNLTDQASPDTVTVTVSDDLGDTGSAQTAVAIKPELLLSVTPSATTIYVDNSVTISNTTENATLFTEYGLTYTGSPPFSYYYLIPATGVTESGNGFFFTSPGTYTITEVVTDANGDPLPPARP